MSAHSASLRQRIAPIAGALAASLPLLVQAAGQVEVSFADPAGFADAGSGAFETRHTVQGLTAHFQRLGSRLPAGQTLRIDVLDVDLAGEVRFVGIERLRVLKGGADWPRISLRYELRGPAGVIAAGEERLTDLAYLQTLSRPGTNEALRYEGRMIDDWFRSRFATPHASLR